MPTTISAGSLRQHLTDTLNRARTENDRIVIERNGQPVAAIISVEDLEALEALEALEDADDARAADEARREGGFRPMEEVFRDLDAKQNG